MNNEGISFTISYIRTICTKNSHVSNIDDDRFYQIMMESSTTLTDTLFKKMIYKTFDLDQRDFSAVVEMCNNWMEMSLRRAINEGERNVIKQNRTEHVTRPQESASKKGMLSSLFD